MSEELLESTTSASGPARPEAAAPSPAAGTRPTQGELLDLAPLEAAKRARAMWQSTEAKMKARRARWKANKWRRAGLTGVRLWQPDLDKHEWTVRVPIGSAAVPPSLNKAARLCRRLKATLLSDPPAPEVTPERDDPKARSAAEFTGRLLSVIGSATGYNDLETIGRAIDMACTYDSAFRRWSVEPARGGAEPLTIMASAQATTVADALDRDVLVPAAPDPATGAPLGPPTTARLPWPDAPVTRYVHTDGVQLTNEPSEARLTWKPGLRVDVLNGNHVRLFPMTAQSVAEAAMVQVGTLLSWREIRALYPSAAAELSLEAVKRALEDRPDGAASLLPDGVRDEAGVELDGQANPERLGFVLCTYALMSQEYPRGACLVTLGSDVVLARTSWCDTTRGYPRPLPIPVDQFKQFAEGLSDPYGVGLMSLLGSGNEVRAQLLGSFLEHLDRFNRRKVFVPLTSPTAAQDLSGGALGDYLPYNPAVGAPVTESVPNFPESALLMFANVTSELDDESGLQAVAQGTNPKGVTSGFHAQQLIEQVQVGLSDVKQATADGIVRGWMIAANLVRTFYTGPHTTQFVGDDGAYKEREWRGQDLDGFQDVRLSKSSFSMMAPSAKVAVAEYALKAGVLNAQEFKNVWRGGVGGLLGVQDDPHYQRIRRQLAQWDEGFDADDPEAAPTPEAMQAAAALVFDPLPVDDLPTVAAVRLEELARCMSGTSFTRHPVPWRAAVQQEYERARAAAGIQTVAEQQAAQAAMQTVIPPATAEGSTEPVAPESMSDVSTAPAAPAVPV
ncbi:MAG: hypothetical protein IT355_12065 [Gemmatimonadaceae bacterium]|nr:hypothetical protein [Gemmatimonadaceae bacterium]